MGIQLYGTGFTASGTESTGLTNVGPTNNVFTYDIDFSTSSTVTISGDFGDSHGASSGSGFSFASGDVPNVGTWSGVAIDGTFTYTITQAQFISAGGTPLTFSFLVRGSGYENLNNSGFTQSDDDSVVINITCFMAGTLIRTPQGETCVEALSIGDMVRTADGRDVPVKWIGRQTLSSVFGGGERVEPVLITAGALGDGLPETNLTVTPDHGMILNDMVVNASALVNGSSIRYVPYRTLPQNFTVYHIETETHDVILANGAESETYLDIPGRRTFDNYAEYVALYGQETDIPEMTRPRITSARLLPNSLRAALALDNAPQEALQIVA